MIESALRFGEHDNLIGVLTECDHPLEDRPAVLILNAGLVHRAGPHRNSVRLARQLAAGGLMSLRFDQAGIGDSAARGDGLRAREAAVDDVRQAMQHLTETRGTLRFIVVGICTGASNAFYATVADERIVAAVMLDGFAYPTWRFHALRLLRRARMADAESVRPRQLLGRAQRLILNRLAAKASGSEPDDDPAMSAFFEPPPPRDEVASQINALVARGTRLYFMYAGYRFCNYPEQLRDALGAVVDWQGVLVDYFPEVNHTATELSSQRRVLDAMCAWASTV